MSAAAEGPEIAYDVSWPQCPNVLPKGPFAFAVIGLNDGRPFTSNGCFGLQYHWAKSAEPHPDIYINLDFPRAGRPEAANGPYGVCEPDDDWCRGYNYGYNLATDAQARVVAAGEVPRRYWLDVEMENHWSDMARDNSQVVRGALDSLDEMGIAVGIYGTSYQWGLITGDYVPVRPRPLWLAGAEDISEAAARCDRTDLAFAGGEIWMVQYPQDGFDGNVPCPLYPRVAREEPVRLQTLRPEPIAPALRQAPAILTPTVERRVPVIESASVIIRSLFLPGQRGSTQSDRSPGTALPVPAPRSLQAD